MRTCVMQEHVPLRLTVSAAVSGHTLLLNLQAIEHYLLRMRVAGIVPDLERKSCPFGKGAACAMHKVLTHMGWRDMAQGAEFHSHAHDSACALLSHNGHDLVEQVSNQGRFMHGGSPRYTSHVHRRSAPAAPAVSV